MELDLSQSDNYGGASWAPMDRPEPTYPCLYLTVDGIEDLPDSGTMKVKYRVRGRTSKEDRNGEETHSADIEILSINSPKKQPDVMGNEDDEEAMESL